MKFLGKDIGKGHPTFICAEAGINHNGNMGKALEMIQVAKDCGADAVKFQKRSLSDLYRKECLLNPSDEAHSLGVYIPILRDCELSEAQHFELFQKCKDVGIQYLCSPWDIESVWFLERLGVEGYKVPSACFSDIFLARAIQKTGKPALFSTGMHDQGEVFMLGRQYVAWFGSDKIAFFHCVSSYPTANRDVNLGFMESMRETFGVPVGYSGHERGVAITVGAIGSGANMVERHFTLDRTLPGPDHAASLEPHGLETLVRHIRAMDEALGNAKNVNRGEMMARETLGKVLTWNRAHKALETITNDSFKATSPGWGMPVWKTLDFTDGEHVCVCDVRENDVVKNSDVRIAAELEAVK